MPTAPRVRFAPSPTGFLHIGGARTALFNWLYARRYGGVFVLRMEDTDRERSTPESVKAILDGLGWLGIDWDEGPGKGGAHGPYFQTERLELYQQYAQQLIAEGKAFRCYCTTEQIAERRKVAEREKRAYRYEGTCRELAADQQPKDKPFVIRFKMPRTPGQVSFTDLVIGKITKDYSDLDDWVMLRGDGIPLYNYGCVLDDHLMAITVVSRGQEHINSTFPQLMLYQALGWEPPQFAHLPLILGPDREKLSKRKHAEADVMNHKKSGILPEALLNFVVRLGWSHGNDEVFSVEQMKQWFDFDHVGSTSGVWNPDKLLWLNQHYLKANDVGHTASRLLPFLAEKGIVVPVDAKLLRVVEVMKDRSKTLVEMAALSTYFFTSGVTLDPPAAQKHLGADSKKVLGELRTELVALPEWTVEKLDAVVKTVSERLSLGMGKVAQPLRVAVTGGTISPGIGVTLELIGRDEVLRRVEAALG